MATLEDKILGETQGDNYCCSSEDEEEFSDAKDFVSEERAMRSGVSVNTGPKGVIEDWRRYKQLENERRAEQAKELVDIAKRLSLTCRSHREDEAAKEDELELDVDEEFLKAYTQKRMAELTHAYQRPKFGAILELASADEYLRLADVESKEHKVLIHLYESDLPACTTMHGCLASLAQSYPHVKFAQIKASLLGTSQQFKNKALPALQIYREGELIGNFVCLADELGEDFYATDVEKYLKDFGIFSDGGGETSRK